MYECRAEVNHNRYEHIHFNGIFAALEISKRYVRCSDVTSVDLIDTTTGEVMYNWNNEQGEYIAPGI